MKKLLILVIVFTSCSFHPEPEKEKFVPYEILKEEFSPDGKVKALIIQETSSLSASSEIVMILKSTQEVDEDDFIMANATCLYCRNLDIQWKSNIELLVTYCSGSLSFYNDRHINESKFERKIFVSLRENVCK